MAAIDPRARNVVAAPVVRAPAQRGITMIEVLVSLLIIVLGLLGLVGLQVRMQQAEFESYQRAQALVLMYDMVDRIYAHRVTASCFRFTAADGTGWLGESGISTPACAVGTANDNVQAQAAMSEWSSTLQGAAETKAGASAGAMVGGRGCVYYNAASELLDATGATIPGTGLYLVSVVWQGLSDTFAPAVNCANGQYTGGETRRRLASTSFRLAKLK